MRNVNFAEQVSFGAIGRAVGSVVALLGSIYIAQEVGENTYGVFYFMMAVSAVLDNPIAGWAQGCRKRFTEEGWDRGAAVGSLYLGALVGSGVLLVVSVGVSLIYGTVRGFEPLLFWILFTGVIIYNVTISLVKGTSSFGFSTWINAIRDVFRVVFQIGLIYLFADIFGMILGIVLINILIIPGVVWWIGVRPTIPSQNQIQSIWSYAKSSIPGSLIGTMMFRTDILMIGLLSLSLYVGNYRVAMNLTMPGMFIGGILGAGMLSQISNMDSRDVDVAPQIQRGVGYASILAIPIAIGCLIMGERIAVLVYSAEYREVGLFIGALGIYRVFQTQYRVVTNSIEGLNRPDLTLRIDTLGLVLNIVLGLGFWYLIGPAGIAWATVISVSIRYVVGNRLLKRIVDVNLVPTTIQHQLLSGIIMGTVVWMARQQLPNGPIWVGVLVGFGGVIYFMSLWTLSEDFRSLTLSFVPV